MEKDTQAPTVSLDKLFKAGAHFAYTKSRRHPSAKPFIFGVKNKLEIFDLEKTHEKLAQAKDFMQKLGEEGATVLFVGGKNEAQEPIRKGAQSLGMPYVAGRWLGGTLTNLPEIKKRTAKLEELTMKREKGELAKYTKKERLLIDREIEKLQKFFSGLLPMKDAPKALFVIDSKREHIAVKEAKYQKTPVISLSGSDCNLNEVDYAIPGNDSSVHSVEFFVSEMVAAYNAGKKVREAKKV